MAKTKVSEFDAVASNNTDINSVNVAEGCPPSGINNAIREMASLLKKQEVGTDAMTSPDIDGGTIDGATIGANSASTGAFTNLSASTGAFTNLTVSGAFTSQGIDDNADATAITIDSSEKVGVGIVSPERAFHVFSTEIVQAMIETSGSSARLAFESSGSNTNAGNLIAVDANDMFFRTNNSERMRIFSDGTGSVGSSSSTGGDQVKFHKVGNSGFLLNLNNAGQSSQNLISSQSGTAEMVHCQFNNSNGNVGTIKTSGSSTVYNTSSDYRLKENVVEIKDATAKLKQLKAYRFNFIADADTTLDGFLAHEVQTIVPEAVSGEKDAVDPDGNIDPQGIDQSKLVPLLVKTIQELEARITALEGA